MSPRAATSSSHSARRRGRRAARQATSRGDRIHSAGGLAAYNRGVRRSSWWILSFVLAAGCAQTHDLTWRFEVPAEVPSDAVLYARIRTGGCNASDEILYEVRPRIDMSTLLPPLLEPDTTYCFEVSAEDAAGGCSEVALSRELVVLSSWDGEVNVLNRLDTAHVALRTCESRAVCDPERGCLRCEDGLQGCPAPNRCCPALSGGCAAGPSACTPL